MSKEWTLALSVRFGVSFAHPSDGALPTNGWTLDNLPRVTSSDPPQTPVSKVAGQASGINSTENMMRLIMKLRKHGMGREKTNNTSLREPFPLMRRLV
jgi:hypothetical protein